MSLIHEALKKVEEASRPGLGLDAGIRHDAAGHAVESRFAPSVRALLIIAALLLAATVYYLRARPEAAQTALVRSASIPAPKPVASAPDHAASGVAYYRSGRYNEAIAQFEAGIKAAPDDPVNHNNAGLAVMALGDTAIAEAYFKEALRLRPAFPEALNNYGALLLARRAGSDGTRAVELLRRALELRPEYADAELNLAVALDRMGRSKDAAAHYERFIQIDPSGEAGAQAAARLAHIRQLRVDGVENKDGRR